MSRSSATSATTTSPRSSPPCRFRPQAHRSPTSRFVVADRAHPLRPRRGHAAAAARRRPPVHRASSTRRRPSTRNWCGARKEHIVAGDVFQVVLSQRVERPTRASAVDALPRAASREPVAVPLPARAGRHRARRLLAGDARQARGTRASVNPIAGTAATAVTRQSSSRSEKDRAEHVMLVDLGRNDLSRVCEPGTVDVERFMQPERFSHVSHLVSEVTGELSPGRRRRSTSCARASPPEPSQGRRRCAPCS